MSSDQSINHPSGDPTKPPGHREDLRSKRNPEAEREAQPATTRLKDRCRRQQGTDRRDDATSDGQHGGGSARDGRGYESYGFGEGESSAYSAQHISAQPK